MLNNKENNTINNLITINNNLSKNIININDLKYRLNELYDIFYEINYNEYIDYDFFKETQNDNDIKNLQKTIIKNIEKNIENIITYAINNNDLEIINKIFDIYEISINSFSIKLNELTDKILTVIINNNKINLLLSFLIEKEPLMNNLTFLETVYINIIKNYKKINTYLIENPKYIKDFINFINIWYNNEEKYPIIDNLLDNLIKSDKINIIIELYNENILNKINYKSIKNNIDKIIEYIINKLEYSSFLDFLEILIKKADKELLEKIIKNFISMNNFEFLEYIDIKENRKIIYKYLKENFDKIDIEKLDLDNLIIIKMLLKLINNSTKNENQKINIILKNILENVEINRIILLNYLIEKKYIDINKYQKNIQVYIDKYLIDLLKWIEIEINELTDKDINPEADIFELINIIDKLGMQKNLLYKKLIKEVFKINNNVLYGFLLNITGKQKNNKLLIKLTNEYINNNIDNILNNLFNIKDIEDVNNYNLANLFQYINNNSNSQILINKFFQHFIKNTNNKDIFKNNFIELIYFYTYDDNMNNIEIINETLIKNINLINNEIMKKLKEKTQNSNTLKNIFNKLYKLSQNNNSTIKLFEKILSNSDILNYLNEIMQYLPDNIQNNIKIKKLIKTIKKTNNYKILNI